MTTKKLDSKRIAASSKKMDSWLNTATGYGVSGSDKFVDYAFTQANKLADSTLEDLYIGNDLIAKIVEAPVKDALREGYTLAFEKDGDNPNLASEIVEWAESEYKVSTALEQADIFARLFGGGAVMIGADDNQELREPRESGVPIRFLRPMPRSDLQTTAYNGDIASQDYGQPALYRLSSPVFSPATEGTRTNISTNVLVDASRFVVLQGVTTTQRRFVANAGWGDSVLYRVIDVVKKFDTSFGSILHLLQDASLGVYGVKGLLENLSSGNMEALQNRFTLINTGKSSFRSIVLDADGETFTRVSTPLTEISNVLASAILRVSAAADMPVTRLFGQAPAGLSTDDASGTRNYYDQVKQHQILDLGPALVGVYEAILSDPESPTGGVVPENLSVEWNSLHQPTASEQADLFLKTAQGDQIYYNIGVVSSEEIALSRANGEQGFPTIAVEEREETVALTTDPNESLTEEAAE